MQIIPVIDLKQGLVVRARLGDRANYRPIETPLSPTSDPVDVAAGFLRLHAFEAMYVADLDAIEGSGENYGSLVRLRAAFPMLRLWVDNGLADVEAADAWLARERGHLVVGSETQADAALLRHFADDDRVVLSLDFRDADFQGPAVLLACPERWPRRVIVMTLARVGSGAGPDFERLRDIRLIAPGRHLYAAGGIRGPDDLAALEAAGCAGVLIASALHDGKITADQLKGAA